MEFLINAWDRFYGFMMQYLVEPTMQMGIRDGIDILILAFILFRLYRFFQMRRAGRVAIGLIAVALLSVLALVFKLAALSYLVRLFAAVAFFCTIVIFQPEIRDALEHIGNLTVFNPRSNTLPKKKLELANEVADETVEAVLSMAESRTGALIVFEGLTKLGDYTHAGCVLDARVSAKMLQNVFYNGSPLHDGALIIRDMRIYAANCVLPSSVRKNLNFGLMGTRHRAAVGVTEVSDAMVIVVSEQTGIVSVAQNGKLVRDIDGKTLKDMLMTYMAGNAYLRHKRANMRKEYLEMLENIGRTDAVPQQNASEKAAEEGAESVEASVAEVPETADQGDNKN